MQCDVNQFAMITKKSNPLIQNKLQIDTGGRYYLIKDGFYDDLSILSMNNTQKRWPEPPIECRTN